jgi:hypothetical protein
MLRFITTPQRLFLAALIGIVPLAAGILPDRLAGAMKSDVKDFAAPDPALFEEYGFDGGEQATFGPTTLKVWRFRDPTGAMAAFQYARPADAKAGKSKVNDLAATSGAGAIYEYGNYVVQVTGKIPSEEDLADVYLALKKVEKSPLPVISTYLPPDGLIPNSERYILGPVSLQKFTPQIPPSVAAFSLSAEAQLGQYRTKSGPMTLAIFNYPTPALSRERTEEFRKLPGVLAKRTGPLVAVVTGSSDPDSAERLLAKINYQANVTVDETTPNREVKSFARTIVNYILFSGLIILFCIFSGVLFAGVRMISRKLSGEKGEGEAMISLHLDNPRPSV